MDISNKTKRPLLISLPGGKKLHLGPGGIGQISPKAGDYPPLKKLLDAGEIEIVDDGRTSGKAGVSGDITRKGSSQSGVPNRGLRRTGDR